VDDTGRIVAFLREIGLEAGEGRVEGRTFTPGIQIRHGALVYDPAELKHPGDLLHEAGHLAIVPPGRRAAMHVDAGNQAAEEMAAIAWSYAAAVHLGLDATVVFHDDGYRGGGAALAENFGEGRYVGVPMLQWLGLTTSEAYPKMSRWLVA
jgi:hypothetical protein